MAIDQVESLDTEVFLDGHIDPMVQSLREQLGVSELEALNICIFSLANRINYESPEEAVQIDIKTNHDEHRIILSWLDKTKVAPIATDGKARLLH